MNLIPPSRGVYPAQRGGTPYGRGVENFKNPLPALWDSLWEGEKILYVIKTSFNSGFFLPSGGN
jgi:hypothetical protein